VAFTERIGADAPTVKGNHGQLPDASGPGDRLHREGRGSARGLTIPRMRLVDIARRRWRRCSTFDLDGVDGRILSELLAASKGAQVRGQTGFPSLRSRTTSWSGRLLVRPLVIALVPVARVPSAERRSRCRVESS
jgi:hypothetical protein